MDMLGKYVKIDAVSGCFVWQGTKDSHGYGKIGAKQRGAHRVAWELARGEIPKGLSVLHRCDNPACVNIEHLWLGTQADNIADMIQKRRKSSVNTQKGQRSNAQKITDEQVLQIRQSTESVFALAKQYGVSKHTILNLCGKHTRLHLS